MDNINFYLLVKSFWEKYEMPHDEVPSYLSDDEYVLRLNHMDEELREFAQAASIGDMVGMADALCDLVYVTIGTAVRMGIPFDTCFNAVHWANMKKVKVSGAHESKRNDPHDVIKPKDFVGPEAELERILVEAVDARTQH
jgi:predicted HAD superfamily Cof-like phosphohydrolase